jgi:2-polyprenyl-3-methyl-5-hydroxy-6-metoxy-1,4-benzoquinol methylase
MDQAILTNFYDLANTQKILAGRSNLKYRFQYLFNNVDLSNKRVLDVGGGIGWITFYAAAKGAQKAVCLEPECAGSSNGMIHKFNEFKAALQSTLPAEHLPHTLQEHLQQVDNEEYDIIVLHNSINHLDEEACINLRKSESSYNTYKAIFSEVYNKMKPGGKLIVADCSCNNFFNAIGVKVSITRNIEWHKHQAPETWIALLQEIGFKNPKLQWSSPNKLGQVGRVFMGNPLIAYFSKSLFKFTMDK